MLLDFMAKISGKEKGNKTMAIFHNAMQKVDQIVNRDYVRRPSTVGQAFNNIGAVEKMMPQTKVQAATLKGAQKAIKPRY